MSSLYTKRAAAAGLAGALALGTIASVGALSPAAAAEGQTTYTCELASAGPVDLPVTGSLTLPSTVESGQSLSGLTTTMGVPQPTALLAGSGIPGITGINGTTQPFKLGFGNGTLPVTGINIPETPVQPVAMLMLNGSGKTGAAKAGAPGSYEAFMPSSFVFEPVLTSGLGPVPMGEVPCTAKTTPASLGTVTVTKATSKVVTKVTNAPVTPAKRAKVRVTVRSTATNTGKVLIKKGKTVLAKGTLTSGRKVLTLTKLGKGSHKLVAIYKGDANTKASKKAFTLKVQR
jgi:hypothetical protein